MKTSDAGILGLFVGIAGLAWAGYVSLKCNRAANKINMTMDELSSCANVNIKDNMVEQAVQNAVDRAAKDVVDKAAQKAVNGIKEEMSRQIRGIVDEAYTDVKGDVKAALESQIGSVNIERIKREIIAEGKEKAAKVFGEALDDIREDAKDKFEDELNSILDRHNTELNSVSRIYGSIADAIGNSSRGAVLKLG